MTTKEKALQWAQKQVVMDKGPMQPKPRNFELATSYRHDAEDDNLLPGDINPDGSPSKQWREEFKKQHR